MNATSGPASHRFTGRVKGGPPAVGRYTLQALARNSSGQASKASTIGFRVIR